MERTSLQHSPIAIVGIGCRLPGGANSPEAFWQHLLAEKDAVGTVPAQRWDINKYYHPDTGRPGKMYSRQGAFLEHIDQFDAAFFGISPREAMNIDPQQRLLLEVSWEALEDAGIAAQDLAGTQAGVFIGICSSDYGALQRKDINTVSAYSNTGSALSIAANRISYIFDLHGPSLSVDTACSSSLVAIHLACESLWKNESTLAFVGGVNIILDPQVSVGFCKASMLSPRGQCSSFAADADGFVRGEGTGIVILKPLSQALADGNDIYAVIASTGINQDGRTNGISQPNGQAQESLLKKVYAQAGIAPRQVAYVEAHGTGTPVGDPIECSALGTVLGAGRSVDQPLRIGSVKTNIGHLEGASGVAGLIKVALALKHRCIPANLHYQTSNPHIPFEQLHLQVQQKAEVLSQEAGPLIAGVNSFGFGGTNAHIVLQEYIQPQRVDKDDIKPKPAYLLPLSAQTSQALSDLARSYLNWLHAHPILSLEDICYTASRCRNHHAHRLTLVVRTQEELVEKLTQFLEDAASSERSDRRFQMGATTEIAFVFSGNGPQWWAMGRQLLAQEPLFLQIITQCDYLLQRYATWSLLQELQADEEHSLMSRTDIAQPALFALQIALVELWRSWGIIPQAVVGHSVGEVAAAYIAGILTFEEAICVIFHRSRLQEQTAGQGKMAAVGLTVDQAEEIIRAYDGRLSLASINSPSSVTLSGEKEALQEVIGKLEADNVFCRYLPLDYAFHSYFMDSIHDELISSLQEIYPQQAQLPFISTVTGHEISGIECDAEYWWKNVRCPVQFAEGIHQLAQSGYDCYIEVGPHPVLSSYVSECLGKEQKQHLIVPSLRRKGDELVTLLSSLGTLYTANFPLSWEKVIGDGRSVKLPTYPWQQESYWYETTTHSQPTNGRYIHPLLGYRLETTCLLWENTLDTQLFPYLVDHQIKGAIVFPTTAYLEMALAAGNDVFKDEVCSIERFKIDNPLVLTDHQTPIVQTFFSPDTGSFTISSQLPDSQSSWVKHASGKLRKVDAHHVQMAMERKFAIERVRQQCSERISLEQFYQKAYDRGLQYGSQFRLVQHLWAGPGEALGIIQVPDAADTEGYQLHPTVLDGCIQIVVACLPMTSGNVSRTYLPVGIERMHIYVTHAEKCLYAYARIVKSGPDYIKVNYTLMREDGSILAEISGLHLQATQFTGSNDQDRLRDHLYEARWQLTSPGLPQEQPATNCIPDLIPLATSLQSEITRLCKELFTQQYYQQIRPLVNTLASTYFIVALRKLGWQFLQGKRFSVSSLQESVGILAEHERLLNCWCMILEKDGIFKQHVGEWEVISVPEVTEPEKLLQMLLLNYPSCHADLMLIAQCGRNLAEILHGEVDPLHILFSDKLFGTMEHFYESGRVIRFYNLLLQSAFKQITDQFPQDRMIRILEIGAGTGGTTSYLLPLLPPDRTEYTFTDVSDSFLARAKQKYRAYPFVRYQLLDIEQNLQEQGFEEHAYDIIVASNVLHATHDLRWTLENTRTLLASDGLLCLLEITNQLSRLILLIFGLLKGFWLFLDEDLRPSQPLLSKQQWLDTLEEVGFAEVIALSERQEIGDAEQEIFLARGPHIIPEQIDHSDTHSVRPNGWLLFADDGEASLQVKTLLEGHGEHVIAVYKGAQYVQCAPDRFEIRPHHAEDMQQLLRTLREQEHVYEQFVYMWGLDQQSSPQALTGTLLMTMQEVSCMSLLVLIQQLVEIQWTSLRLSLVTSGTQVRNTTEAAITLEQAPLYGLGRVISNEYPEWNCTLIDISAHGVYKGVHHYNKQELQHLCDELLAQRSDGEILLRDHARYINRVVRAPLEKQFSAYEVLTWPHSSFCLSIPTPGVLDNLSLHTLQRAQPQAGEVEVEVYATGLNFKDIMQSMGLINGEALEVGYSRGLSLGLECSGRVVTLGEGVENFQVGDEVIAIARHCFSPFVVTGTSLVVHKPAMMGFEEGATVMGAFLTAYYALHYLAHIRPGERVLIHGAAGGVGLAAIQIVQHAGGEVFATAGSSEKRDYLHALGVKYVMDSRSLAFADEIMEITHGEGVHVVLNSLAGEAMFRSLSVLRRFGRFLEIGKRDFLANSKLDLYPFEHCLSFNSIDIDQLLDEDPSLVASLLQEIMSYFESGTYHPLPHRTFQLSQCVDAFRYMQQSRHIGKIVVSMRDHYACVSHALQEQPLSLQSDASYLITGGLGGFGLITARWLIDHGARHLLLVGRGGASSEEARQAVEALRAQGAQVLVARVDVTQEEEVIKLFKDIQTTLPPLRGVIHAAMALEDCLVQQLTDDVMKKALAPKMLGAWYLHSETLHMPLDFFVCFSSITSLIGNPGQGNYVAGNAFLDTLAYYRRSQGLPALTVNWGALAQVGYVAQHTEAAELMQRRGVRSFSPDQALWILDRLLQDKRIHTTVADVDWARFSASLPVVSAQHRLEQLLSPDAQDQQREGQVEDFSSALSQVLPASRQELVRTHLYASLARVLGTSSAKLDPERSMSDIGLDSLMAMELHNRIEQDMGIDVPVMQLYQARSIADLVSSLTVQLVEKTTQKEGKR